MSADSNTASIPCPTCGVGEMVLQRGRETAWELHCNKCPEYFYGGRGMCAIWANVPTDREAAHQLLESAYGL